MKYKILIADDDYEFSQILRQRLESSGYDTACAYEGVRAIEASRRELPDLILLDWKMPAGLGSTVLEALAKKDETRKIPVIVITALTEKNVEDTAKKLGAKEVFHKPFEIKQLLLKIHESLEWAKLNKK